MWKKTKIIGLIGLLLVILMPGLSTKALSQLEPYGVYEDWKNPEISADRWRTGRNDDSLEVTREIHGNRLEMKYRVIGSSTSNTGALSAQNRLFTKNPSAITQIETDFKVISLFTGRCQANLNSTRVRPAAIDLNKFNDGTTTGGTDMTGDHFVRVLVNREADSSNPEDVLTASAFLFRCLDPVCGNASSKVFILDMGKVSVGDKFTLRIIWDNLKNRFIVGLNDDDFILSYDPNLNKGTAKSPFATIRMTMVAGNCTAEPIETEATTEVREVRTNRSAVIP
jgi:hypothetical protein